MRKCKYVGFSIDTDTVPATVTEFRNWESGIGIGIDTESRKDKLWQENLIVYIND